jgi:hypothetical protein
MIKSFGGGGYAVQILMRDVECFFSFVGKKG